MWHSLVVAAFVASASLVAAEQQCLRLWAAAIERQSTLSASQLFRELAQSCRPSGGSFPDTRQNAPTTPPNQFQSLLSRVYFALKQESGARNVETVLASSGRPKGVRHLNSAYTAQLIGYVKGKDAFGHSTDKYSLALVLGHDSGTYFLATSDRDNGALADSLTTVAAVQNRGGSISIFC